MKVYCNGDIVEKDTLAEIFEPGFLFGWGAFETLRAYKTNIPFLNVHIERLNKGFALLDIAPVSLKWEAIIKDLLSQNSLEDAYIRITIYKKRQGTGVIIYVADFGYYPPQTYEKGFSAIISPTSLNTQVLSWKIKSLSYLEKRLAWLGAQKAKKDEALIVNQEGCVVGGSRSNLFLVKDNEVITPSSECGVFEGITKSIVKKILLELTIKIREAKITDKDLFSCKEAFLTSALIEVMPLVECDSRIVGSGVPGETTLKILSEYRKRL